MPQVVYLLVFWMVAFFGHQLMSQELSLVEKWSTAKLVWSDEFEGDSLDLSKWTFETGAHGWGNWEWQDYTQGENVQVDNGTLKIVARKTGQGQQAGDYTSARLNTTETWTYGRIEVKARVPIHKGNGLWPAIWMLGENIQSVGWPKCGEIDIMEYVSFNHDVAHQTLHSQANNHMRGTQISSGPKPVTNMDSEFHTYGILWDNEGILFYIDRLDNIMLTAMRPDNPNVENWPFDRPFYLLLNMAVGGSWGGRMGVNDQIFPSTFEIDYVRVYQKE